MADIDLHTLLDLVGTLTDSTESGSASERFRKYLSNNVTSATDIRAYIEVALSQVGDQYNKSLQDLINHIGQLLGFEVTFGRYRGVRGQVGFDGLWKSPSSGWAVVVEVKTTDVYAVKTATVLGYINSLVSDNAVTSPDKALGLYVYGRFDSFTNQLENAIIVENRRERLRVVSVPALIDLLELKQEYGLDHSTVLNLLLPFPVRIDPIVNLIRNVVAQEQEKELPVQEEEPTSVEHSTDAIKPDAEVPVHKPRRSSGVSLPDYTGKEIHSVQFLGKRLSVQKWRQAMEFVIRMLVDENKDQFELIAPTIAGRKRPYISSDPNLLRVPAAIPKTNLFLETNLSANQIARVCFILIEQLGYESSVLRFETN